MKAEPIVLKYRDYEALPADGRRYELHEGELSVAPAPSPLHQRIVTRLVRLLANHVAERSLGEVFASPVDVILNPPDETTVVQPDLVYLDRTRLAAISLRGIEGAPTLVVEVQSPSSTITDRRTKPRLYARYGVPYFWLVDPEARSIEVFALGPDGYAQAQRAAGSTSFSPAPFPEMSLVPDALWA